MSTHAKAILLTVIAGLSGCAGAPPKTAPPAAATQKPDPTKAVDRSKLVALEHSGYTIVNQNGKVLYCDNSAKTGTRIARETVCLTEEQLRTLRERTQENMGNVTRQLAPPQGK